MHAEAAARFPAVRGTPSASFMPLPRMFSCPASRRFRALGGIVRRARFPSWRGRMRRAPVELGAAPGAA
ncbi:hypothetical protein, partial [Burkholderia gladioli]|uniref:hypothetical protein n=1 Tax=Burkholderia gladioli TaxID=28095 RepID=UPI003F7A6DD0